MSTKKLPCGNASLSERLRTLRGERNKAEFSRYLGISAPVYQRYENGRIPNPKHLSVIGERCQVSVDWLLKGEEPLLRQAGVAPLVISKSNQIKNKLPPEDEALVEALKEKQVEISKELGRLQEKYDACNIEIFKTHQKHGLMRELTADEIEEIRKKSAARAAVKREGENKQNGGAE